MWEIFTNDVFFLFTLTIIRSVHTWFIGQSFSFTSASKDLPRSLRLVPGPVFPDNCNAAACAKLFFIFVVFNSNEKITAEDTVSMIQYPPKIITLRLLHKIAGRRLSPSIEKLRNVKKEERQVMVFHIKMDGYLKHSFFNSSSLVE